MLYRFLIFCFFIFLVGSCSSNNPEDDYSSSTVLSFNLLKVCLDKTLNTYSEYNTQKYILDLSKISTLYKPGIDSFLKMNNSILPVLQDDSSTIIKSIIQSGVKVLPNNIIRFEEIEYIDKNHAYVVISKVRSRNQIITLGLDLRRQADGYEIFKSETKR